MPTLQWIGKDKVVNHHLDVPYHTLTRQYSFDESGIHSENIHSENKIIHGDNLLALKSLLPLYEGRINCIYIDPPYNTGNEGWVYNDNVNDPRIKKWLGETVGKEGEDLSRHDKWLCMMYPRLKLLHRLLADDGAIFISIDDNEQATLKLVCDELFGMNNFVGVFVINTTPNARDYGNIGKMHEYCICYAKDNTIYHTNLIPEIDKSFRYSDEKGGFNVHPLYNSNVAFTIENRPNLYYPFYLYPDEPINEFFFKIGFEKKENSIELFPPKSHKDGVQFVWRWGKEKSITNLNDEIIGYLNENGEYRIVQKMRHNSKVIRSLLLEKEFTSRRGTAEVETIFNRKTFVFPKPEKLIERFIYAATSENSIILDSFAGSGTTAHAVLNLNKQDGGTRKFILVEMEDYAENITAERVRRVINGYGEGKNAKVGTGGSFSFYELGDPLLIEGKLNEDIEIETIREYIWFTETKTHYQHIENDNPYFLGLLNDCTWYFYYEKEKVTVLNKEFLDSIKVNSLRSVIYADINSLSKEELTAYNITFKKIPRDIAKL